MFTKLIWSKHKWTNDKLQEKNIDSFRTCIDVVHSRVDIPFQCDLNDKLDHC
jgi:hypothetical protein